MKLRYISSIFLAALIIFNTSCETDDIEPEIEVSLSASEVNIFEDNGTAQIRANLNAETDREVTVTLLSSGSAIGEGEDYQLSSNVISIPTGSLSGSVTLTAIQDTLEEGNEVINLAISSVTGVQMPDTNNQVSISLEDDDVAPVPQIIVNEVLYDPPSGAAGDANGDGTRDANEDEFVEFYNSSIQPIDLSGFIIYDSENLATNTPRHIIPDGTVLQSGEVLVVFGGGTPTGNFGGVIVQTASEGRLNLNNAGDVMTLTDTEGNVVVEFDVTPLSNNPDESYTRNPDITGEFEQHGRIGPTSPLYSPGTKIDGTSF